MRVKIYIEGGGNGDELHAAFRKAWTKFFQKARLPNMPRIVCGQGRTRTFDLYRTAVRTRCADVLPILLVDSEDIPATGHRAWQHLRARPADGWDRPDGAGDDDAFLMICCMETWFVADKETLAKFCKQGYNADKIPKWPNLEMIPKQSVFDALDRATADSLRPYAKGTRSFELLGEIDPLAVSDHCAAAKLLLDRLRMELSD